MTHIVTVVKNSDPKTPDKFNARCEVCGVLALKAPKYIADDAKATHEKGHPDRIGADKPRRI